MKSSRRILIISPFILAAFFIIDLASPTFSAEPTKNPILRIETGQHIAEIKRIATDSSGRWLVTVSVDKSLRVWELPSGRLFRIIRPPIGKESEGMLYSVALSPDGNTIACGGSTGFEWNNKFSIYLFNRASGNMIGKLSDLPDIINHLTFSPKGDFLAAAYATGLRFYRTIDWSLAGEDNEYGDQSYSANFSRDGKLVTTSLDGYLRLYDVRNGTLPPPIKIQAPGGNKPYSARFSPDGSKVAVGYLGTSNVSILSTHDLSFLPPPDTSGTIGIDKNPDLWGVIWSSDGRYLFAGSNFAKKSNGVLSYLIRRWSNGGWGNYTDIIAAALSIMDMVALPDGSIVYSAGDSSIGMLDQSGKRILFIPPATASNYDNINGFRVANDGATISFAYETGGKTPATFDIRTRSLTMGESGAALLPPLTEVKGLAIDDWNENYEPKLNGVLLQLVPYERSISRAIAPDGKSFILGTDWYVRCYDHQGNLRWATPSPSIVWTVNVSGNNSVVIAAFGDGTIRWYRMSDGKELLALFSHTDKRRWILWTRHGYYDTSIGGEDLIGWQVNRGKDQAADFFPASRFRVTRYRPDIVSRVLMTLDVDEAVRQADAESKIVKKTPDIANILPPVVEFIDPADGRITTDSNSVTLRYRIRSPSDAPTINVRALVNSRPVPTPKGVPVTTGEKDIGETTVIIPEENCEIAFIAENRNGESVPATILVNWRGKETANRPLPRLFILAIGVGGYEDKSLKLKYAAKDADDFVTALKHQEGLVYSEVIPRIITDTKAKKADILIGLRWLENLKPSNKDYTVIFLSGHGENDPPGPTGVYYFLPQNAVKDNLTETGLGISCILDTVRKLSSEKVLLFIDTCKAGNADFTGVINRFNDYGIKVVVFASSRGDQQSLELDDWKNGAFTKALVEGIEEGKAAYNGTGEITITDLEQYVKKQVQKLTKNKQNPEVGKPMAIDDFTIAKKEEKPLELPNGQGGDHDGH